MTAIVVGALQPTSPIALKLPGAWFFGVPPSGSTVSSTGFTSTNGVFGLVCVYGGLVIVFRVWCGLQRTLSTHLGIPVSRIVVVIVVWVLPLLVAPPLFSRDMYSNAAQGEMVSHHLNPYLYGPSVLGSTGYLSLVDPIWRNTSAPYGPFFMTLDGWTTTVAEHSVLANLVLLRLLELIGVGLAIWAVPVLARSFGKDPAWALALGVLNPLVLLYLVGGGHNDALMVGLLVAGLALARRSRPLLGVVVCTLAMAVKMPAVLGVLCIGWTWAGPGAPWRRRMKPLVTSIAVSVAVLAILATISGLGWGWITELGVPSTVWTNLTPTDLVSQWAHSAMSSLGLNVSLHTLVTVDHVIGVLAAMAISVRILRRHEDHGGLRAMGLILLVVVILGPIVQAWYFAWGIVVLAPIATGRLRSGIVALSGIVVFSAVLTPGQLHTELAQADPLTLAEGLLALLGCFVIPLEIRVKRGLNGWVRPMSMAKPQP